MLSFMYLFLSDVEMFCRWVLLGGFSSILFLYYVFYYFTISPPFSLHFFFFFRVLPYIVLHQHGPLDQYFVLLWQVGHVHSFLWPFYLCLSVCLVVCLSSCLLVCLLICLHVCLFVSRPPLLVLSCLVSYFQLVSFFTPCPFSLFFCVCFFTLLLTQSSTLILLHSPALLLFHLLALPFTYSSAHLLFRSFVFWFCLMLVFCHYFHCWVHVFVLFDVISVLPLSSLLNLCNYF